MTREQIEAKAEAFMWCILKEHSWDLKKQIKECGISMAQWALSHQWVSVEDELPKDKQNVFIRLTDGRSTSGWYSHSIEEWFISVGEIGGDNCLYERVTHWMPIPPLAEEGGNQ